MSEEEMIEYLVSTGLYKNTKSDLFYEKRMINTNKTIPISELIERFISVDKDYYDSVNIGDTITDDFRMGSLIMKGSFGNWDITVENKEIQ